MARKLSADDAESIRLARQLQEDDDRILAQELHSSYQAGIFSPERVTIPDDDDDDDEDDEPMIVDERPRALRHIYNTVPLHHLGLSHNEVSSGMSPDTAELLMRAFHTHGGVWNTTEDSEDEDGLVIINSIEEDNYNERSEHYDERSEHYNERSEHYNERSEHYNERSEHSNQLIYSPQRSNWRLNQLNNDVSVISADESPLTADDDPVNPEPFATPPRLVLRSHTRRNEMSTPTRASIQASNQPTAHVVNQGNQRTTRSRSVDAARTVLTVGQTTHSTDHSAEHVTDSPSNDGGANGGANGEANVRVTRSSTSRGDEEGAVSGSQSSSRGRGRRRPWRRDPSSQRGRDISSQRGGRDPSSQRGGRDPSSQIGGRDPSSQRGGRDPSSQRSWRRDPSSQRGGRRADTAHRTIYQGIPLVPDLHIGHITDSLQPLHLMIGSDRYIPNYQFMDHSLTYEEMSALDEDNLAPGQGIDKRTIEQHSMVKKFKKGEDTCSACNICLTDFEDGEKLRTLPCFHIFHSECIDNWLSRSPICPVCRTIVNK